jgi:hypothetical protein
MASIEEQILRTTKEIIVKFIETGRLSPTGVHDAFKELYQTVNDTVKETRVHHPEDQLTKKQ